MSTDAHVARRDAIADYRIVGAERLPHLERLVALAAAVCGVPTAVVNIIDDTHQHQIAAIGLEPAVCAREDSMCAAVLHESRHIWVTDAREDPRFAQNPFVTGQIATVRFYASSPIVTPAGITIGTLCVFDDEVGELTAQQSEALDTIARQVVEILELRRVAAELRRSNEQLAQFASQVSHDLRNPLTALGGFLELAEDDPGLTDAPMAAESVARARSVAARMTDMVVDLLAYARAEGVQPRRVETDVAELASSVIEDLDAAIESTGASVAVEAADPVVVGDPTLLRALLQNLVANAIKFSSAAGVSPRIAIRAEHVGDAVRLTVDDNGPGIPVDDRERVFGLLERGSTTEGTGLGIGLATCRRIAESHGGRIGVEDSPLGGARVWVVLPDTTATDAQATLTA
ncbi:sensor histidine kinase [Salinibacterium soli]|uniref:Sensor-like histidine kinase SenX3 n=1 Tax=Antiquaquibacter soli TaxID=3064523 RepID=A0ABT9BPE4_9MICO|nr:GAF domain-containing sensor histidine kinase [Protaetiibacter sp. WY-16]MDO7881290.1 GAF domain-containing sensor histidine kinase [Protaetiibacter sp. WY-16]